MNESEPISVAYNKLRNNLKTQGLSNYVPIIDTLQEQRFFLRSRLVVPTGLFIPITEIVFPGEEELGDLSSNHIAPAANRLVYLAASERSEAPLQLLPDTIDLGPKKETEVLLLSGIPKDIHPHLMDGAYGYTTSLGVEVKVQERSGSHRLYGSNAGRKI